MDNINIKNKQAEENEVMYHIGLSKNMIKDVVTALMPGDPNRVEFLAKMFDKDAKYLNSNREYTSYTAKVGDQTILVISTGMGGPSTGIGVEELAMIGIKNFIRIGTCGTIQERVDIGDNIVTTASVRLDGTSMHYAPVQYPAVASFEINNAFKMSSKKLGKKLLFGVTASSDTFYPGQERYDNYSGYVIKNFQNSLDEWRKLNVLNFEMESSAMFTMCAVFGLNAACICNVLAKRTKSEKVDKSKYEQGMKEIVAIIKDSIENNFYG